MGSIASLRDWAVGVPANIDINAREQANGDGTPQQNSQCRGQSAKQLISRVRIRSLFGDQVG
jgi:hypothetical protein